MLRRRQPMQSRPVPYGVAPQRSHRAT